jgi:hypothetical protein
MVHLSSFRKVKAFGRTNFISSTGCPSEHPEQRGFVGIFGNGLTAVSADTFHVSCLNAVNTPLLAFQPPGTLTFINVTPAMAALGFPFPGRIAMIS